MRRLDLGSDNGHALDHFRPPQQLLVERRELTGWTARCQMERVSEVQPTCIPTQRHRNPLRGLDMHGGKAHQSLERFAYRVRIEAVRRA